MPDHDYAAGLRDGEINSIKERQAFQTTRLDKHDTRIATLEKVAYIVMGAVLLLEFAPAFKNLID